MRSGASNDYRGQWGNGRVRCADPQSIAEVAPERQTELLAGLREAEHAVARLAPIATDRPSGNLPPDHKATQISFRRIGVERDFGPFQNPQQFLLAAPQPRQQFVEIAIAGADRENPIKPGLKTVSCTLAGTSLIVFQLFVKEPDQLAQGFDVFYLARRRRHQLVQKPFGMDPTQRMGADPKLPGIVGDDHCIADQPMMADGTPYAGLGEGPDDVPVKNVDAMFGQMAKKRNLIGEPLRFLPLQRRQKNRVHLPVFEKSEGGLVEDIVLIVAAQQGQKVQPRLRGRRAKGGEMLATDMRRMKIAVGMASTGVIDRHIGRRDQAGMQHGGILGVKAIQPLRQKPDDLSFGNLDTDIVEQGRQSLRRDLPMRVQHKTKPSQIGPKATSYPRRQRRDDGVSLRRQPAFPPVTNHLDPQDQIPDETVLVALEARSRRSTGRKNLFTSDVARVAFGAAAPFRPLLVGNRHAADCLFHPRGSERRARRQVFQPRNLVAQKLVVDLQPSVFEPELIVLIPKPLVFSFELLNPGVCPISTRHQAGHELTQRLQRQRVGMLDHGQAALRHAGSES